MKTIFFRNIIIAVLFSIRLMSAQQITDSVQIVQQALEMINFPEPLFSEPYQPVLSPKAIEDIGFEQPNTFTRVNYTMSDGVTIYAQKYKYPSTTTVVYLHGTLASSYTFNKSAGLVREALQATVITIDLRGHGQSGGVPGDVSEPNQYAHDLDEILTQVQQDESVEKIIVAGHSMGGGIILRYAETFAQDKVAGYVLFAPHMGTASPTVSQQLDVSNNFIKSHLSRGLGIKLLNEYGIHTYDSLPVVFYNLPEQMPLRSYSYRSMQASMPHNYIKALTAITKPLLLLVGASDEVFNAAEYTAVCKAYSEGDCYLQPGESHSGIRHNQKAMEKLSQWGIQNHFK